MQDATQDFDFDVVIVGASFAGAACAIAAAQRGLRVCVLERKRDPGDKLRTTGIIVKEAAERTLLHRLPAPITRRIESVRLYAPSLKQVALAAPGYYFLTTDTPAAMRWLAGHLREHGVDLRLGCAFTDAQRIDGGWQVQGAGSTRYLVGADGARSRVAKRCGLGEVRQFLYGIEYEFPGARLADPDALHCFISKRYAPGYIGWLAQNPGGVQAGLALRHDPANARVPDIDGFLLRVGLAGGLPRHLKPGHTRAGLIPCSGPVAAMARDNAILTGDAAGIVSPVTAGGIHAAWDHGWAVGRAIASHLRDNGPQPEQAAIDAAPRFRAKRALRWAYDRLQFDWPFDLLLHSPPLRWAAEQVYFHKRRSESAQSPGLRVRQRSERFAATAGAPGSGMQRGHRCMQVRFLEQLAQAQFHLAQVAEALRRVQGVGGPIAESAQRRPTANADIAGAGRARPQGAQRGGTDALRGAQREGEHRDLVLGHGSAPPGARVCAFGAFGASGAEHAYRVGWLRHCVATCVPPDRLHRRSLRFPPRVSTPSPG